MASSNHYRKTFNLGSSLFTTTENVMINLMAARTRKKGNYAGPVHSFKRTKLKGQFTIIIFIYTVVFLFHLS